MPTASLQVEETFRKAAENAAAAAVERVRDAGVDADGNVVEGQAADALIDAAAQPTCSSWAPRTRRFRRSSARISERAVRPSCPLSARHCSVASERVKSRPHRRIPDRIRRVRLLSASSRVRRILATTKTKRSSPPSLRSPSAAPILSSRTSRSACWSKGRARRSRRGRRDNRAPRRRCRRGSCGPRRRWTPTWSSSAPTASEGSADSR